MYTATIKSKSLDKLAQRLILDVEFTDGTTVLNKKLFFAPTTRFNDVKLKLKSLADEFEKADTEVAGISEGLVDFDSAVQRTDPLQGEWFTNYNKLEQVQKLIDLGVLTGTEPKVVALRDKVKADFKPEYLKLI